MGYRHHHDEWSLADGQLKERDPDSRGMEIEEGEKGEKKKKKKGETLIVFVMRAYGTYGID